VVADRRVTVFGDGRQTRDYVHIDDVVAAWLAAAGSDVVGALNISRGAEVSVLDLVEELDLEYEVAPGRSGEITRSCLDPSAANHVLDWRAMVPLQEGLRRTLDGVRRQEAEAAPRVIPRTPQA
jgi:UDP-glucose 4-epimerase